MDAFDVAFGNLVSIVGAGGKTSLMYGLGREVASGGHPALLTTTTKIMYPPANEIADVVLGEETEATAAEIGRRLRTKGRVLAGLARLEAKITGFSPAFVETLRCAGSTWTIVAECDGAKGKSLKVPKDDEPPVALSTEIFVVVIGADCLGKALTSDEVFEPERVAAVAGVGLDATVDKQVVMKAVLSGESYLGRKPPQARFCVFINKVDVEGLDRPGPDANRGQVTSAFEVGLALKSNSMVERVVYGSLQRGPGKGFLVIR